jgi:hypothetical protein
MSRAMTSPRSSPNIHRWLALSFMLLALGALSACDTPPTREPFPKLTYAHLPAYRLEVARVDLVEAYHPPMTPPNVDQQFPVSPAATAMQWGRDRLKAAGGSPRAVYTVLRADAIETHLAGDPGSGLFGDFTIPQSERYDLNIAVRLQIVDPTGRVRATVDATAVRSRTVAADATLNDRERVWFDMTEQAMIDLNASLEKSIPLYIGPYLR